MATTLTKTKIAFNTIQAKRDRPWKGEEEVRSAWITALESATDVHFDMERSKKDSSRNHVIIEFKAPGLFKGNKGSAKFKEATDDRLLPYILKDSEKTGIPQDDYIGIAIDGDHICFAQVKGGKIDSQHLLPFSEYSVDLVLSAIKADTRRAVTVENLIADFGHGSNNAKELMQAMADALASELACAGNTKIKMLFEEWRALYGQVADMSILQLDAINKEMCFIWNGSIQQAISARLFVIHTYNSLLIKLLAAEIVSAHGLTTIQQPAQALATCEDDSQLLETLYSNIERAGIFSQAGINGFVEEAIFSWYIDVGRKATYSKSVVPALRNILNSLSLYRTDRLNHTRDVLRDLYQGLVPGKLRQSLGEFYTPDWLVDFTVDKAQKTKWLGTRVLDPTCGSGAFLLAVIRLMRKEAALANIKPKELIETLCTSIWGFDLNPLAVQTARVNFLMEIADLLKAAPGIIIEIPVLLADAIYSPAPNPVAGSSIVSYQIGSQVAGLDIQLPSALAFDRFRLDAVFERMGEYVELNYEFKDAESNLLKANLLTNHEATEWREPLRHTYNKILDLHRQQWNGIWFRVVRNFFWSATAGHFDTIVGNPPWVRWSKLPAAYRERVKPTCEQYGIFSNTKLHGGNELDISAMITFTTADKWLKPNGRLAFVITGAVFKNPSSGGFRLFKLNSSTHLKPVSVDDMKALKPFDDASNHTVVALFDKAPKAGTYPIPYRVWNAKANFSRAIPVNTSLSDVLLRVDISGKEAAPVENLGTPWAVLDKGRHKLLKALAGTCTWTDGRKGITTDLNGVYFVPILRDNGTFIEIESQPNAGKKNIGSVQKAWIEPTLMYPLIKGAGDFEACYMKTSAPSYSEPLLYTFVPNSGISTADYRACTQEIATPALKRTKAWFANFKTLLDERSTYRRQMKGAPNHAVYNVGDYTFQPWKVIWPEMSSTFYAAVAGNANVPLMGSRPYVPDHKIYFAGFDDKEPAYFLCGLLNTGIVREWIQSHTVNIQVGNVFKHTKLPKYDASNSDHVHLASIVELAHAEHNAVKRNVLLAQIELVGDAILAAWIKSLKAPVKKKTIKKKV